MKELPKFLLEPHLHLELRGYEENTSQHVYSLSCDEDALLLVKLEVFGYVQISGVKLSNGEIVDGWLKAYNESPPVC